MRKSWTILLLFLSTTLFAESEVDVTDVAWQHINNKNYSAAIDLLNGSVTQHPEDFKARFLLSRVYGWNQNIPEAISHINFLLDASPQNADYLLTKARFLSWQENNASAIDLLTQARQAAPDYQEIWHLEIKLRQREANKKKAPQPTDIIAEYEKKFGDTRFSQTNTESNAKAVTGEKPVIESSSKSALNFDPHPSSKKPNSLFIGYGHDQLDNNTSDWSEFTIGYNRNNNKYSYALYTKLYSRFDTPDQEIFFDYTFKNFHDFILSSSISFSLEKILTPEWSLYLSASRAITKSNVIEVSAKHNKYTLINSDIVKLSYSNYWKKFVTHLQGISTFINTRNYVRPIGYLVQASYFFDDNTFVRLTHSSNTEIEYAPSGQARYEVTSYGIDGKMPLTKNIEVNAAFVHHIQGDVYKKNGIYSGLRYKF